MLLFPPPPRVPKKVRSWKEDRHSVAYLIEPVDDMNEITYHCLEVINTHLFNTKGPLPGKSSVGGGAAVAQPMNVREMERDTMGN